MKRAGLILLFVLLLVLVSAFSEQQPFTEAPTGFDDQTNGAVDQSSFSAAEASFSEVEFAVPNGLGPVYNAQACRECHQDVVTGSSSQVKEIRAGHKDRGGNFVGALVRLADGSTVGPRSLINQRAICAEAEEYVPEAENIRTLRISLSTLGDGFVEAVPDDELKVISQRQAEATAGRVHGEWIEVPILEASGAFRVGRFGWKDQHASLLSFSGDAYLNEMGITNRPQPTEVTASCNPLGVQEPNNLEEDIDLFTTFIRATKAPPRDGALAATADARHGEILFARIGCATCHVPTLYTAPPGVQINGGNFTIPDALGNKVFHPYGDFLLHDIGTGDGIVQNGPEDTADKLRTMPLWGARLRPEKMHDGRSLTFEGAIERHGGEAAEAAGRFRGLTQREKEKLIAFLRSL